MFFLDNLLIGMCRKVPVDLFFETGTGAGRVAAQASNIFGFVFTVEIAPDVHKVALDYFASSLNVQCLLGSGALLLPEFIEQVDGPVLYCLDTEKVDETLEEIEAIVGASKHPYGIVVPSRCNKNMADTVTAALLRNEVHNIFVADEKLYVVGASWLI